jgi:hypothetical protein
VLEKLLWVVLEVFLFQRKFVRVWRLSEEDGGFGHVGVENPFTYQTYC